jgi:hypothetical protein
VINIPRAATGARPSDIYPYFDAVAFWLRQPADAAALHYLRRHCGSIFDEDRPARFDPSYRQFIVLRQPDEEALRWLDRRRDRHINYLESAVDYTFDTIGQLDDAEAYLARHQV